MPTPESSLMLKHLPIMEVSQELLPFPIPMLGSTLSTKHPAQPASLLPGAQCLSGSARWKEGGSPLQEACAWLNPRL